MSLSISREPVQAKLPALQKTLLKSAQQTIHFVEMIKGQSFRPELSVKSEESIVIMNGVGRMKIGGETKVVTPVSLVKMTADKVTKIYNDQEEPLRLYFISATVNIAEKQKASEGLYIRRKEECFEIVATELERIYELFGKDNGKAQMHSVALVDIYEGGSSARHYHPIVNETYVVVEGEGRLVIGSEESIVKAGDTVAIPVGVNHQIFNTTSKVLRLVVVVTPPWTMDCGVYN